MSKFSRLESMRPRILDFEKEIDSRIEALVVYENEILNTALLRKQWIASVSYSDTGESQAFRKKIEILRAQSELSSVHLMIENAKLEDFHDSQTLLYLIAATKPYDEGETGEKRRKTLNSMAKESTEDLKAALTKSTIFHSNIFNTLCSLIQQLDKLKLEHERQNEMVINQLQRRIFQYTVQLRESSFTSKAHEREITGDYLVLRHNSRVAKEILIRSQSEATSARRALQDGINQVEIS
jgi:hypothetical protein